MRAAAALLVLLCAPLALADFEAPITQINLDLPPVQRWQGATRDVLQRHGFDNSFGNVMDTIYAQLPQSVLALAEPILDDIVSSIGDYGQEIQGIMDVFTEHGYDKQYNMTVGRLMMMNIIYELTAFCTSIVGQNTNGSIFHGRNLDYNYNGLTNLTYTAQFTSGGAIQYYGTAFIGYVGLLTGMRPGAFSVSVDERGLQDPTTDIILNFVSALQGGQSIGFFLRDTLAAPYKGYADLINTLNTTRLIAPVYLITAGVNAGEGAVMTRDRDHADDSQGVANGTWFINPPAAWYRLETNYDHWMPVPNDDNRRDPANDMMTSLGQSNINTDALMKVLGTAPVNNGQTTYSTVMSPGLNLYHTIVRLH